MVPLIYAPEAERDLDAITAGDAESTVKRFYVRTLEPGVGKKWFNLPEKTFLDAVFPGFFGQYDLFVLSPGYLFRCSISELG